MVNRDGCTHRLSHAACLLAAMSGAATAQPAPSRPMETPRARGQSSEPPATAPTAPAPSPASPSASAPVTRTVRIPGTTVDIELVKVPPMPGSQKTLWVGRTEVTWDQYDVFVYALDEPAGSPATVGRTGADAVARPSKPYVPPDRGFGHNGFPAMGMTHHGASSFCAWLTTKLDPERKSGLRVRLPTEAEWEHAARAGDAGLLACEAEPGCLGEIAWFAENSERSTHHVAQQTPNAFGLFDVHGNVAEWVAEVPAPSESPAPKPKPLAKGGSYLDPADRCTVEFDLRQSSAWNASDPQIPKSTWWLADCPFVGFRIVMEDAATSAPTVQPAPK